MVVVCVHGLAALAVLLSVLPGFLKLLLGLLVLANLWHERAGRAASIASVVLGADPTGWSLQGEGREPQPLQVLRSSIVTPWLVVLHARTECGRHHWLIGRDSLDAEEFRLLRVYLRVLPIRPS